MVPLTAVEQVMVVNVGSSSLKLRVLDAHDNVLASQDAHATTDEGALDESLRAFLEGAPPVNAVGHRIVHGGFDLTDPLLLTDAVDGRLDALCELAPLHNPPAIAAARAMRRLRPDLPSVACFDTGFHTTIPPAAATYALPAKWTSRWPLRRTGFHGLSHAYASRRAAELLDCPLVQLRLVTAHLGAGASLAAVHAGRSVDTTMGFTPLDGLVMATRPGSVDPGLILWIQRHAGISAKEAERALEHDAGLLGLSRRSGDMREVLLGADAGDDRCRLAVDVYVHRLAAAIAAMAAAMNGLDGLVFTGGVGEHAWRVRAQAAQALGFLGVSLDRIANEQTEVDGVISEVDAAVSALVVTAREDIEIARQTRAVLA